MRLRLNVITYRNQPPTTPQSAVFEEQGGSLGRGANSTWVLPDTERFISSKHATIACQAGRFTITDTSTNGLYINNAAQALGRGNTVVLSSGDRLVIGDYTIEVTIEETAQAETGSPLPAAESPFGGDDFFNAPPVADKAELAEFGLNEPNQPLGEPSDSLFSEPVTTSPAGPPSIEEVSVENEFFQPPQSIPDDWDILGDNEPQIEQTPPIQIAKELPTSPVQPVTTPRPPPAVQAAPGSELDALKVILQGAGVPHLDVKPEAAHETLHLIGELMREMVGGLMEVLRARADIKSEFRMQLTTIRPVENNPLKFSIRVDDAVAHLLSPGNAAYLSPQDAVHEAVDNIEAHQLAVMAGMQGALTAMLQRFEPTTLEAYFERKKGRSMLGSKKAWYWELFGEKHKEILAEAEDNFQDLFGEEFAKAYEKQIAKLAMARRASD